MSRAEPSEILTFQDGPLTLRYAVEGEGPPLVLVHGLSGSRHWWRFNLPALRAVRRVYTVELAGFGSARGTPPLPLAESADLIARGLERLPDGPADLIGHSMGGQIALHLAARHPALVRRLVLADASGLLRVNFWRVALRLPAAGLAGRPDFLPVIARDALASGLPTLLRATRDILRDDVAELLPRVKAPTLVVWGGRDVLTPPELGRRLAAGIAHARLTVFPRAGHVVMVDAAEDFNREVLAFLQEGNP